METETTLWSEIPNGWKATAEQVKQSWNKSKGAGLTEIITVRNPSCNVNHLRQVV